MKLLTYNIFIMVCLFGTIRGSVVSADESTEQYTNIDKHELEWARAQIPQEILLALDSLEKHESFDRVLNYAQSARETKKMYWLRIVLEQYHNDSIATSWPSLFFLLSRIPIACYCLSLADEAPTIAKRMYYRILAASAIINFVITSSQNEKSFKTHQLESLLRVIDNA